MKTWCRVIVLGPDGSAVASWPVLGPGHPDLSVVDGLARLQLNARRRGNHVLLADVCDDLRDLLDLAGLRREVCRQADDAQSPSGADENAEPGDGPG